MVVLNQIALIICNKKCGMLKYAFMLFIFLFSEKIKAQLSYSYGGFVSFYSKTPLKDIYAKSDKVSCVFNFSSKEIAIKIINRNFKFENSLMEDHFNEKYIESDKYPNSVFTGKLIENIDFKKQGTFDATLDGSFNIHGVANKALVKGKVKIENGVIQFKGDFVIKLRDYKIEIPSLLLNEIAEQVDVKSEINFKY